MPYTILTSSSPEPLFTSDIIDDCCTNAESDLDMMSSTEKLIDSAVYDEEGNVRYEILLGDRNDTTHANTP